MIVRCKTCLATIVEGEVIRFNTHTRMVIIRPTPTLSPFNNGLHMVNLDFVEEIRAVRMCASMPPVHADFDVTRHEVMEETEMEQYADRARQWARYESLQKESVNKPYLDHNVKKHRVLENTKRKKFANDTCRQNMLEDHNEENVDKNYRTAEYGQPNKGTPSKTEITKSEDASKMGEPDVKVMPEARRSTMYKDATEEVEPGDTTVIRKEPNMRHGITTHKYVQTKRSTVTPEEGRSGGHS